MPPHRAVMPGMVMFRRRWSVGSDDLVLPALFLFLLHCIWLVVLSVVLFGLPYGSEQSCSVTLVDHGRGYLGILVSCLICESAIMWLSMRGSILYTQPREAVQYVIYIRLAILLVELVYAVVGIAWLVQYYQPCSDVTAKNLALGIVACNWLVIFSVCITLMCTFDPTGRTFVKLKATRRRQRNLTTYTLRLEEGQASSWSRRLKFFMCCTRAQDTQSDAYSEVASLFAEFFRDLDIVPSDIIAGLVLLRQRQRSKRSSILDQGNNDILAFLSGMPVTRNTRYLDLKNSVEMNMYKDVCYYMLFALAAYGWPMYLMRKPVCGLCRLASSCPCMSVSSSRMTQAVTVEEDNCCGCNVLAIRRHFLDRDLKQVQIVYTSCHDAVYETPFFVAVDHAKKKVVISIRGTLSPKDALTDLTGDSERLPVEEQHGTWLGHKGMVFSAEYIKKKLEQEMILSQAFGRDLNKGTMHYGLVIVGHSLGAGTAAILSFLLRPQYPTLHCYSYSPPGGLFSEDAMEYSKEFVTSVVLGKDLVPRLGLSQLEGFRRHLLEVLQKSNKPKWRIIAGGTKCIPKSELPVEDEDPQSQPAAPPAVACGSTPVTSALPFQPPPPSTLPAGSSMWCTTILQRHAVARRSQHTQLCGETTRPSMRSSYHPPCSMSTCRTWYWNHFVPSLSRKTVNQRSPKCINPAAFPLLLFPLIRPLLPTQDPSCAESLKETEAVPVTVDAESFLLPPPLSLSDCTSASEPVSVSVPQISNSPSNSHSGALSIEDPSSIPPQTQSIPSDFNSYADMIAAPVSEMPSHETNSSQIEDPPLKMVISHGSSQIPEVCSLHMPNTPSDTVVLENYNKGKTALLSAAKIMVSPTEVDLNPESMFVDTSKTQQPTPTTHHRRNSSVRSCAQSEISLDGFAECPPPPVPVVLRGARERLTVELRDRKAPLALMESLSDAESLYSLDSRRSLLPLGVHRCCVASRSLWMPRSPRRTRLSAPALNSWLPTASVQTHQSTWARSGLSLPQWTPDPPQSTPCVCPLLPPAAVDMIPQLC
ncbi:hypothetical protein F7725_026364 [Dissostichus mawsoni]|uniref:Diacylglycerol lipase-alpha n=1 Tax=Dissostichus mawsoni TaxID=36200 RepID=A0A7J5X7T2_DISMA|nr:hypothetical protein F7725_026364 [Dissostichus mawsoni]